MAFLYFQMLLQSRKVCSDNIFLPNVYIIVLLIIEIVIVLFVECRTEALLFALMQCASDMEKHLLVYSEHVALCFYVSLCCYNHFRFALERVWSSC